MKRKRRRKKSMRLSVTLLKTSLSFVLLLEKKEIHRDKQDNKTRYHQKKKPTYLPTHLYWKHCTLLKRLLNLPISTFAKSLIPCGVNHILWPLHPLSKNNRQSPLFK